MSSSTVTKPKRSLSKTKKRVDNSGTVSKMDISIPPALDLKEAISSARKTFKRDLKNSASSTPASLSPKQSEPKSASAPASPVKQADSGKGNNMTEKRGKLTTPEPVTIENKRPRRSLPAAKSTQDLSSAGAKAAVAAKKGPNKPSQNPTVTNDKQQMNVELSTPKRARTSLAKPNEKESSQESTNKKPDVRATNKTPPKIESKTSKSDVANDTKQAASKKADSKPTQSDTANVVKSTRKRSRPTSPKNVDSEKGSKKPSPNEAATETPVSSKRSRPSTPRNADAKTSLNDATQTSTSAEKQNTPKSVESIENKNPEKKLSPKELKLDQPDPKESTKAEEKESESMSQNVDCKSVPANADERSTVRTSNSEEQVSKNFDDDSKRRLSNNVSMNEVIKLHQDEGIIHLLHALPASRRKPAQMMAVTSRRPSSNEARSVSQASGTTPQVPQASVPQQQQKQSQNFVNIGRFAAPAKRILQDSTTNFLTSHLERADIKPCTQEELMNTQALALIKQLPSKEYIRLWSSPARYSLANSVAKKSSPVTIQTSLSVANGSTSSPSSSVGSDISSVSAGRQMTQPRAVAWTLNSKNYKDILIRTYPTFAQVIISPVTTGLKNSINVNVCDELIDALKQLSNEAECRAVLVSGLGSTFCQGVDLTILTYDSADRQRRSAENLASAIKRLATFMLSYPKILLAAVNGVARGLGVTILPFFDVVFASDKATFSTDYTRLGQIPECFASQTFTSAGHLAMNEILLFGKTVTATEAVSLGLVSSVLWPDKFLEEIVPRVETLEAMPSAGLKVVKMNMKSALKRAVNAGLMEEETKQLVANWTHPAFAKTVRSHLKTNRLEFQ